MTATEAPPRASLTNLLIDVGRLLDVALERRLKGKVDGVMQLRILELVGAKPMQPSELAPAIGQEIHSVSGMLNRLEDRGVITRVRNTDDRRTVHVELTAAGRAVVEACAPIRDAFEDDVLRMVEHREPNIGRPAPGTVEEIEHWRKAAAALRSSR